MAHGTTGARSPRLGAALFRAEALLVALEVVACGVPAWLALRGLPGGELGAKVLTPLALAMLAAAALRLADRLRPVRAALAAAASGTRSKSLASPDLQRALDGTPRESAVVHFALWAALGVAAVMAGVPSGARGLTAAAAQVQLVLVAAAATAAARLLLLDRQLAAVRAVVLPNLQATQVFSERYRGWLTAVALASSGMAVLLLAFGAWVLVRLPAAAMTTAGFVLLGVVALAAVWWLHTLRQGTLPIEQYFEVTVRRPGTKGPARDEPRAAGAFVAAQALPYRLAGVQGLILAAAGVGAVSLASWWVGLGAGAAARLFFVLGLTTTAAVLSGTAVAQQILRPLLRHLGSRHSLTPAEVRSPLGLGRRLALSMAGLLVLGVGATLLFERAPASGPGAWSWLVLHLGLLAGLMGLAVRDVVAPLRALEERSSEMGSGQLARPVPPWGEADEIGRLAMLFEQMRRSLRDRLRSTESINVDLEREVRRRTEALEQRNAELHDALDKLRRAQDNLIRSEKLASMGRLVAGIAHEINNPVNAVINSLGPLEQAVKQIAAGSGAGPQAVLAAEAQEILAVVQRGATRTKAIVQALHGYARGDESVEREVSLARSVDETLGLLAHRLRQVRVDKQVDPAACILGFPGQIDQVLMNLITNGAQAIGGAGGTIRIWAGVRDECIVLTVADDGPGIPPEVLPRIFDPFFTTKDVGEGAGLGLSIVHGIIERHHGRIEVESKPGQGTTFTMLFPRPAGSERPAGGANTTGPCRGP